MLGLGPLLLALLPQAPAGPVGIVWVRMEGPLEGLRVEAGGPPTRVELSLGPGEVRLAPLPVEGPPLGRPGALGPGELTLTPLPEGGAGRAWVLEWEAPLQTLPPVALDPRSPGSTPALERLSRRSRPPLAPARITASGADLALVLALALGGLALRRRPLSAVGLGLAGAALICVLPAAQRATGEVRVLEGDLGSGAWIEVRSALGRLPLETRELALPATRPEGCERSFWVELGGPGPERWWALAPGCGLSLARRVPAPGLDLERNDLGRLEPLWLRTVDGHWEARAPWEPGRPPPPVLPPGSRPPPPAWLAASLPQGRLVLVAGLARAPNAPPGERWVRVVGP